MLSVYTYQEFCEMLIIENGYMKYVLAFPVVKFEDLDNDVAIRFQLDDDVLFMEDETKISPDYELEIEKMLFYGTYLTRMSETCLRGID
jgi:hypothetical protein